MFFTGKHELVDDVYCVTALQQRVNEGRACNCNKVQ